MLERPAVDWILMLRSRNEGMRREGERGFTMMEVIISLGILSLIAGAITGVFITSLRDLAPGGAQARLAGSHDLAYLESLLGKDGARATCIATSTSTTVYGQTSTACSSTPGSTQGYYAAGCASAPLASPAVLCLGWPVLGSSSSPYTGTSCHVAVYKVNPTGVVTRTEYQVAFGTGSSSFSVRTQVASVNVDLYYSVQMTPATSFTAYTPPGETYTWLRALPINLKATGVSLGAFSETLTLHPVATDPGGAASAVTTVNALNSGGDPC